MARLLPFASLPFLLLASPLLAQHWTALKTPNIEIYTTKDQSSALQELQALETIRSFFNAAKPFGPVLSTRPVQVVTFRSASEFAPYAFRAEGGAYYVHSYKSDYILIGDIGSRDRALIYHEFTHMVATQAGLKLPVWLNEGLADFYSTVETNGKEATIGHAPVRYLEIIRHQKWMPWEALFSVDVTSPLYNGGENLGLLYSQSWALTHMLELDAHYAPHFGQFLSAVSSGQKSIAALQSVYHKTLAEMNADLSAYIRGKNLPVTMVNGNQESPPPAPVISDAADFDVQLALASILASKPGSGSEGREKLATLSVRFPERPEPEEEMGMLGLQQNKRDEARRHLSLAVQRHSNDPDVYFNDAVLEKDAGSKYGPVSALFRQALKLQPDLEKARLELGFLEFEDFQYKSALSLLSSVADVPADSQFEVDFTIAQCYVNLDDSAKAEKYVKKAAHSARTADQKQDTADLLESVQRDAGAEVASASAPPKVEQKLTNVRGQAKLLQCASGQKLLTLDVNGGHEMTFDIANPHLVVRNPSPAYPHWTCGQLKAETLTIVYRPQPDSVEKTAGLAVELVF